MALRGSDGRFVATVVLEDEVSQSAHSAAEGVRSLRDSMSGLEKAAKTIEGLEIGAKLLEIGKAALEAGSEFVKFALEASEKAELLKARFDALGGGVASGEQIFDAIRNISKELPESESVVQSWASHLMAAGVTDFNQLRNSLKAVAGAEALVEGGGERVRDLLARVAEQGAAGGGKVKFSLASLSGTGLSETDFLKALGMTPQNFAAAKKAGTLTGQQIGDAITKGLTEKSKGALEASMNTWDAAVAKGKDLITHLFEGIDVAPLMAAVRSFFDIFDLANPSGQAIKAGIGGAFGAIFGAAADGTLTLKHLFLETELGALKAYNYIRPLVHKFLEWGKTSGFLGGVLQGFKFILLGVGAGILAVTAVVVTAVAAIGMLAAGFVYLIGRIPDAIAAVLEWNDKAGQAVIDFVAKMYQAGKDFVLGFVGGIKDSVGAAVDAAKGMAKGAWGAVSHTLKLGSPSKLMFEAGQNTSKGFAQGVNAGSGQVTQATKAMAATPANGAGAQGAPSQTSHRNTFNIEIHAKDGATAHELLDLFEEQLASVYERLALSQGVAP